MKLFVEVEIIESSGDTDEDKDVYTDVFIVHCNINEKKILKRIQKQLPKSTLEYSLGWRGRSYTANKIINITSKIF